MFLIPSIFYYYVLPLFNRLEECVRAAQKNKSQTAGGEGKRKLVWRRDRKKKKRGGGRNEWREWGREEQSTDECPWMLSRALSWRADMQHHTHFRALYQSPSLKRGTHTRWARLSPRCSASKHFDAFLLFRHGDMVMDLQWSWRWILQMFASFMFELVTLNLMTWLIPPFFWRADHQCGTMTSNWCQIKLEQLNCCISCKRCFAKVFIHLNFSPIFLYIKQFGEFDT